MKEDTIDFNQLFIKDHFNFTEKNCDPFLIQTSLLPKKNLATGGGLRALQQRKTAENN